MNKDKIIEKLKRDLVVYMKGYKVESTFTEEEINLIIKSLESEQTEEGAKDKNGKAEFTKPIYDILTKDNQSSEPENQTPDLCCGKYEDKQETAEHECQVCFKRFNRRRGRTC